MVEVPPAVYEGLEHVRRTGLVNMLDRNRVQAIAYQAGYFTAAWWIDAYPDLYSRGVIFEGFETPLEQYQED